MTVFKGSFQLGSVVSLMGLSFVGVVGKVANLESTIVGGGREGGRARGGMRAVQVVRPISRNLICMGPDSASSRFEPGHGGVGGRF